MRDKIIALSLGWGVQSFTLAAMSALGDLPKIDFAIHSDTLHEKKATYDFAAKYTPWLEEHGVFVAVVNGKDISEDNYINQSGGIQIPVYNSFEGKTGQLRRQCTKDWKILPIRRFLQEERVTLPVELWFGISTDEFERARDSDIQYITQAYPLLDMDFAREDCVDWLVSHDLDVPPKSACVFCPYTYIDDWKLTAKNDPEDFAEAVRVDNLIRNSSDYAPLYLTRHLLPLVELIEYDYVPQYALDAKSIPDAECDSGHCFM